MIEAARSHPMSQQVKTQDGSPHLTAKQSESDSEHPLEICNQPCYWSAIANNCRFLEHCFCMFLCLFSGGVQSWQFYKDATLPQRTPGVGVLGCILESAMRGPFKLLQFQYDLQTPLLPFFLRDRLRKKWPLTQKKHMFDHFCVYCCWFLAFWTFRPLGVSLSGPYVEVLIEWLSIPTRRKHQKCHCMIVWIAKPPAAQKSTRTHTHTKS